MNRISDEAQNSQIARDALQKEIEMMFIHVDESAHLVRDEFKSL